MEFTGGAAQGLENCTPHRSRLFGRQRGKEIDVQRVAFHEYQSCGHLIPTPPGQAKVDRYVE
jgi:hypothetical protein